MKKLPILLFTFLAAFALQAGAQDVAALKAELAEIKKRVATMEKLLGMSGSATKSTKPEPVVKGQTAANSFKPATLSNGARTNVPPFVGVGERLVINTTDGSYVKRAD